MRIAFNYYRVLQTINLPFSFVLGYMYGLAAFVICFCTAGLFASALFFEWYYQQRYYFYFNRGFSRFKLIGFSFGLNVILAAILLITTHFIMGNLLEVDSVIISFDHKQIVTDCYLKCATGEVIGILGRNGCSKSSLLKVIFGTLSAKSKFIRINGQVYDQPYKTGNLIAYLPQHAFLPQNISIKRIINIFISDENSRNKILSNPMLKKHLKKRISALSGGELRYLEILLLLNLDVKFILLDEPFSKVEPLYKQIIIDLIQEYRPTKGFIITDHDYINIISASDKIILISNGVCRPIDKLIELEQYNYVPVGTFS